jgi:hypothetical protein
MLSAGHSAATIAISSHEIRKTCLVRAQGRPVFIPLCVVTAVWLFNFWVSAQILVNGMSDRATYTDSATFTVPAEAGYTYVISLNTNSVPPGVGRTITQPDYYELAIRRTQTSTGTVSNRLVRFIVAAGERGGTVSIS